MTSYTLGLLCTAPLLNARGVKHAIGSHWRSTDEGPVAEEPTELLRCYSYKTSVDQQALLCLPSLAPR